MNLTPGTVLQGRYQLQHVLGQGGFGITYLGEDLTLKLRVAIKEYLPLQLATRLPGQDLITVYGGEARERFRYGLQRFLEEAQALARFAHHPHVVSVRDYFEANGTAYMVMEYVEGVTFHQYLQEQGGRISPAQAKGIMLPIMAALQEVHQAGLLHRDISPDNIYLIRNGPVKLLDFGAARYLSGEQSTGLSIILKSGYAPEEQYRPGGHQGAWTDVYAVAATFYRAITGVTPPDALDRKEGDTLVAPSRLGVSLSADEDKALLKGLAVSAEQRYQSMAEFQEALMGGRVDASMAVAGAPPVGEIIPLSPGPATPEPPAVMASDAQVSPVAGPAAPTGRGAVFYTILFLAAVFLIGSAGLLWRHLHTSSPGAAPASGAGAAASPAKEAGAGPPETPPAPAAAPSAATLLAEGKKLYQDKQFAEALDKLEEAARLDPALAEAHYYVGMTYLQFSRFVEAVTSFKQALAARPDYAQALAGLGAAYYQLDQTQEAIQALEQALKLDATLAEARYYLGLAYLAAGDTEQARKQYQALQLLDQEKAELLNQELPQAAPPAASPPEAAKPPETPAAPAPAAIAPPYRGPPRWLWTSQRLATESELATLSLEELRLMRNEILARNGWVFRAGDHQDYFHQQPWYRPRGTADRLVEINRAIMAGLNQFERQNYQMIIWHEMRRRQRQP